MSLYVLKRSCAKTAFTMLCLLLFCSTLQAQLRADFEASAIGGCSPLSVSFINKTSGASSNAIYKWDFGNGNTSGIFNPGAIYTNEQAYTVTLTVQDGTQTATKTLQITVYSKPTVDFSTGTIKGCLPLPVHFTSHSTPGSGSISSYHWDFGNGSTQQGFSNIQPHTYTVPQKATVSLTVTNSFGCHTTAQKKDIVEIIPAINTSFNADKRILCRETDPVQFTNTSSGPGTLSYLWDFGDGTTTTEANPAHVFNKRGIYTVKLTVNSSEGCSVTSTQNGYINVATFSTNFSVPSLVCSQQSVALVSSNSPYPNNSVWEVDGLPYSWYGDYFNFNFSEAKTYKVKLTNTFGTCIDSAVKLIEVKPSPASIGFIANVKGQCGAPVAVEFRDTTANARNWQWNLDWTNTGNIHSTVQAPTHTYTENRLYHVLLKVTNTSGCMKEIYQVVNLPIPTVHIFYTSSSTYPQTASCEPITMKFASSSSEAITQYLWGFGDGGTSTVAEPEHQFSKPGTYQVTLHYTTVSGCTGVAYFNSVTIYQKPEVDFRSLSSNPICGNTPVTFSSMVNGAVTHMNWYIDDQHMGSANFNSLTYRFSASGKHSIKLIAFNGQCSDTAEKIDYVDITGPFPQLEGTTNTCDGTRGLVTFSQNSKEAISVKWDFGDGYSETISPGQASISHTYTQTGTYKIKLTAHGSTCSLSDSTFAYVMLKKDLTLTGPSSMCVGANLNYTIGNLQDNPLPDYWNYNYYFSKWEYEDNTQFGGYNGYYIDKFPTQGGTLSQPDRAKQKLRVILSSVGFNCADTSNYIPIKVIGPEAALEVPTGACFNTPVTLKDISSTSGSTITRWEWNFGDGQVQTTTQGGTVTHTYPNPGSYSVYLRVTDNQGCSSTTPSYTQYVNVNGPRAAFTASGTNVPLNTTVYFYNNTTNHGDYNTVYDWDFGDGGRSNGYSPSHTFDRAGTYTVKMVASNAVTGCRSETSQVIVVKDFNSAFNFNTSFITSQSCPPVLVRFSNTSLNYTRVTWDFGDGIKADNVNYPSHIYDKPGKYIITLYVYGPNGLKGTYTDSVVVQQPTASLQADDLEGCIGNMVTLNAKADSTRQYIWDFGDGQVMTTTDSFSTHQYKTPGIYSPALLIKDVNGCSAFTALNNKITIRPDPVVNITPAQPIVCLGSSTTLQASGGVTYTWSPVAGLDNSVVASTVASPITTTIYSVQVADDIGCKNSGSVTVTVVAPITLLAPGDLSVCAGNSVILPASGAVLYNWIGNTSGLSHTDIARPTATPSITTTYTVTGSDAHKCFTDTADITVRVLALPIVDAGVDVEVQAGVPVSFSPTYSPDVIQWIWSPASYLNCSQCPNPISTPMAQTTYTLTVKNGDGCTARDSLLVKMICDEARVAIPNAFSPNGDSHNDLFIIKGISVVKHLLIYNRWGQKVFERTHFIAADRAACWDGTLNGFPASAGTYVYFVEMECPTGGVFTRKGSFVLVR